MSDDERMRESPAAPLRKRAKRPPLARAGELWARCPECRMPVKDAELFTHLMNCPGADARQAEWKVQEAAAKPDPKPDPEVQAP